MKINIFEIKIFLIDAEPLLVTHNLKNLLFDLQKLTIR